MSELVYKNSSPQNAWYLLPYLVILGTPHISIQYSYFSRKKSWNSFQTCFSGYFILQTKEGILKIVGSQFGWVKSAHNGCSTLVHKLQKIAFHLCRYSVLQLRGRQLFRNISTFIFVAKLRIFHQQWAIERIFLWVLVLFQEVQSPVRKTLWRAI